MTNQYLTMWEASRLCSYSQEYLSLLSRQGLLRAEKKNNKWLTTREWLLEYVEKKKPGTFLEESESSESALSRNRNFQRVILFSVLGSALIFLTLMVTVYLGLTAQIATLEKRTQAPQTSRPATYGLPDADMFQMFEKSELKF